MTTLLSGKTAIVTGGGSGIGRATALALADAGAAVVVTGRRMERLDAVVSQIVTAGGKAVGVACDAGLPSDIDTLLEKALAWGDGGGKYDIVVGNAGRGLAGGVLESDTAQWEEMYRTNVLGLAYLLRQTGKYFVERKSGDIVAIGSSVGRNISPFSGVYGASKFAVAGLAEALRREVCTHGVRVSLIMPGIVVSGFQDVAGYNPDNFGKWVDQFGTLLTPDAIAESIRWIVSLPPNVNVNEIMIRPTGQAYP